MKRFANTALGFVAAFARRLAVFLLPTTPEYWSCVSLAGEQPIRLKNRFLAQAGSIVFELRAPWAPGWAWLQPRLSARLKDAHGLLPLGVDPVLTQEARDGNLIVKVRIPAGRGVDLGRQVILELNNQEAGGRILARQMFSRLDRDQILGSLESRSCAVMAAVPGNGEIVTDHLHDRIEHAWLQASFHIKDSEVAELLRVIPPNLSLDVRSADGSLARTLDARFTFEGNTANLRQGLAEALPDITGHPGNYELRLRVQEHELAKATLEMRAWAQLVAWSERRVQDQARIDAPRALAINHHRKPVALDVVAEDFQALLAEVALDVPTLDPLLPEIALPVSLKVQSARGTPVAQVSDPRCLFRTGRNQLSMSLPIHRQGFHRFGDRATLELQVGGRLVARFSFVCRTRAQIEEQVRRQIHESIVVEELELAVIRDGAQITTQPVFGTDHALVPQFTIRSQGFTEDITEFLCPMEFALEDSSGQAVIERPIQLRIRPGRNRCSRMRLHVSGGDRELPTGVYRLKITTRGRNLATHEIQLLAAEDALAYTRHQVLENLEATASRISYVCGSRTIPGDGIPSNADRFVWKVTLRSEGFNSLLPQWPVDIALDVAGVWASPVRVAQGQTVLSPQGTTLQLPVVVKRTPLEAHRGSFELRLSLSSNGTNRVIARATARILTGAELAESVTVQNLDILAHDVNGRRVSNPKSLEVGRHRDFEVGVDFELGVLAPGLSIPVRIELACGNKVVLDTERPLQLDNRTAAWRLAPVSVEALRAALGRADQSTLVLRAIVDGTVRLSKEVRLGSQGKLTAFDGSLREAPNALGDVRQEYDQILRGLRREG